MAEDEKEKTEIEVEHGEEKENRKQESRKKQYVALAIVIGIIVGGIGYVVLNSHGQAQQVCKKVIIMGRAPNVVIPNGYNYSLYKKQDWGVIGIFPKNPKLVREVGLLRTNTVKDNATMIVHIELHGDEVVKATPVFNVENVSVENGDIRLIIANTSKLYGVLNITTANNFTTRVELLFNPKI